MLVHIPFRVFFTDLQALSYRCGKPTGSTGDRSPPTSTHRLPSHFLLKFAGISASESAVLFIHTPAYALVSLQNGLRHTCWCAATDRHCHVRCVALRRLRCGLLCSPHLTPQIHCRGGTAVPFHGRFPPARLKTRPSPPPGATNVVATESCIHSIPPDMPNNKAGPTLRPFPLHLLGSETSPPHLFPAHENATFTTYWCDERGGNGILHPRRTVWQAE